MCEYTHSWRARYVADDADALRTEFEDNMREFAWAYQRHLDVLRSDLVGFGRGRGGGDCGFIILRPAAARARSWRRLRRGDGCPAAVAPGH